MIEIKVEIQKKTNIRAFDQENEVVNEKKLETETETVIVIVIVIGTIEIGIVIEIE